MVKQMVVVRCGGCDRLIRKAKAKGVPNTMLLCKECDAIDREIEARWKMYSAGFNDAAHAELMTEGR